MPLTLPRLGWIALLTRRSCCAQKEEGRIVVTADLDYPRLLALSAAIEPSLVLFRGGNWADDEIVARLATLLDSVSEADFKRIIFVVEPKRIRRRHLPIG